MAVSELHPTHQGARPTQPTKRPPGPITAGLLEWRSDGACPTPFGGSSGSDAASLILLKANALTQCLASAFSAAHEHRESEFSNLVDSYKALALEGIGDLIMLAKVLVDEA